MDCVFIVQYCSLMYHCWFTLYIPSHYITFYGLADHTHISLNTYIYINCIYAYVQDNKLRMWKHVFFMGTIVAHHIRLHITSIVPIVRRNWQLWNAWSNNINVFNDVTMLTHRTSCNCITTVVAHYLLAVIEHLLLGTLSFQAVVAIRVTLSIYKYGYASAAHKSQDNEN